MGWRRETLNLVGGLGAAFASLDDFGSAEKSYSGGLAIAREVGDSNGANLFQISLADVYTSEGRLPEAETIYRHALSSDRNSGRHENLGNELSSVANVLRLEGKPEEARRAAADAVSVLRVTGAVYETGEALTILGDCLLDSGDLESARKRYEEARNRGLEPEVELALANVSLEAREPAAAQTKAADAIRIFRAKQNAHEEALSRAVLIRAMLAQGKVGEAIEAAKAATPGGGNESVRSAVLGIAVARDEAATGRDDDALSHLSTLMAEAEHLNYRSVALQARLAHAEILAHSGDGNAATAELNFIAYEADRKGLALIARESRERIQQTRATAGTSVRVTVETPR